MVPITFLLADALDIDPIPLVIIEIVASNIGGTATLIGDPPNILIAGATDLSFIAFIVNLAPIVVAHALVVVDRRPVPRVPLATADRARGARARDGARRRAGRSRTPTSCKPHACRSWSADDLAVLRPQAAAPRARDGRAGRRHGHAARQPPAAARRRSPASSGRRCSSSSGCSSWSARWRRPARSSEVADGIAVGHRRRPQRRAARHPVGVGDRLGDRRQHPVHRGDDPRRRAAAAAHGDDAYWWALALGACFGGNATIIAAAANVAAAGMAARAGRPIGFVPFLKVGLPVTLVSLVLATAYVAAEVPVMPTATSRPRRAARSRSLPRRPVGRRGGRCRRWPRERCPALPVVDGRRPLRGHLRRARVHPRACSPRYLDTLGSAAFVPRVARRHARDARCLPRRAGRRPHDHRPRRRRRRLLRRPARRDLPPPPRAHRARRRRRAGDRHHDPRRLLPRRSAERFRELSQ